MDREWAIEKAKELLKSPSKIKASNKRGAKRYIREDKNPADYINEDAIEADGCFDGYYAIATNEQDISSEDAISAYHNLWKIEDSFRIMK